METTEENFRRKTKRQQGKISLQNNSETQIYFAFPRTVIHTNSVPERKKNRNIITKNGENDGGNHEAFRRTPLKTFGNFSRILAMTWYLSFEKLMVGFPFSLTKLPHSSLRISEKM